MHPGLLLFPFLLLPLMQAQDKDSDRDGLSDIQEIHKYLTDPEKAGPEFQVQGEYVGKVGGELPIGIQVIALGKQESDGVLYTGGLPGAQCQGCGSCGRRDHGHGH